MAVVNTEKLYVGGKPFTRKVKCSSMGKFSAELPSFIADAVGVKNAHGNSLGECLTEWRDHVDSYVESTTSSRYIIIYDFETKLSFSKGVELRITAAAIEESTITHTDGKEVRQYNSIDSDLDPNLSRYTGYVHSIKGCKVLPLTKENIAFFNALAANVVNLTTQLEDLLDKPDDLARRIDSGIEVFRLGK